MEQPLPFSDLRQVLEEIEERVPLYSDYLDLDEKYQDELGSWEKRSYRRPSLKGFPRFSNVRYSSPARETDENYPFTLITEAVLPHFGTGTRSSRSWRLKEFSPQIILSISITDAQKLGVSNFDQVRIISPVSSLTAAASVTDSLPEGLYLPFLPGSFATELFAIDLDAETKTPVLKACKVRIEKIKE